MTALTAAAVAALAVVHDPEAAVETPPCLGCLALLAPPSTAFAAYFGGWHALRHTARVVDALVAGGQLPPQRSLPRAFGELGRRSAWAAVAGLIAAGGWLPLTVNTRATTPSQAVLSLTVPHMTTVAMQLTGRGR